MKYLSFLSKTLMGLALGGAIAIGPVMAGQYSNVSKQNITQTQGQNAKPGFSSEEIMSRGHMFFGNTTKGLAQAVEYVFSKSGSPQGYIIGQEGSGAIIGGLRYGEGILYLKNGTSKKVYWQGPSIGIDLGGNGSRTLVLVYNIDHVNDIFDRFFGLDGSAYLIGGFGVNYQSNEKLSLAPIRTGMGARLGANIGYLKYTAKPSWNPF